jgi:hypothetical protein
LLIQARAAKPVSIMKTLSGTFAFKLALLAVIAIVAVLSLGGFAMASGGKWKFSKPIGGPGPDKYAELKKPQKTFDDALIKLKHNEGDYHIKFLCKAGGKPEEPYDPHHHQVCSIKTDKVTTSEVAKNAPAGEAAADDPHAVYRVQSNSETDINDVLDAFK